MRLTGHYDIVTITMQSFSCCHDWLAGSLRVSQCSVGLALCLTQCSVGLVLYPTQFCWAGSLYLTQCFVGLALCLMQCFVGLAVCLSVLLGWLSHTVFCWDGSVSHSVLLGWLSVSHCPEATLYG